MRSANASQVQENIITRRMLVEEIANLETIINAIEMDEQQWN